MTAGHPEGARSGGIRTLPLQTPSQAERETLDEMHGRTGGCISAGGPGLPAPRPGQAGRLSGQLLEGSLVLGTQAPGPCP